MLIVSYGDQREEVGAVDRASSAFVSCIATLANTLIGVRPHIYDSSERARRTQLLATGIYAPGIGVARQIASLPAPRILRIYDVETGAPARRVDGTTAKVAIFLDRATVQTTEYLQVGGTQFELLVKQFIGAPDAASVSASISMRPTGHRRMTPVRVRLDYGIDASALNEYLGTSPWLMARHYDIGPSSHGDSCFSAAVSVHPYWLYYEARIDPSRSSRCVTTPWSDVGACAISATLDFSVAESQQLFAHWHVRSAYEDAKAEAPRALSTFAAIEREHRIQWTRIWHAHEVEIDANRAPIELGMRYAVFQLIQHGMGPYHREHGFISPARGLTSTYHSGATFFDTELHKCMFWIWNDPAVARALIDYRYRHLEEAIAFARATGFAGARFPEAANDRGGENGPRYVLSYPSAEIPREWSVDEVLHISADTCYALHRYWLVTGDDAYMGASGGEIVMACAEFCASAFEWSDSKQAFVVNRVMGPDEYHYHVDNSFYTNYLLRWCMRFALSLIDGGLTRGPNDDEVQRWHCISNNVYLPWMDVDGVSIPEEFEGYGNLPDTVPRTAKQNGPQFVSEVERCSAEKLENFPSKAIKQADIVLLLSLFPQDFSRAVKRSAWAFYEPRTVHESSLSYGPHAMVAADIGERAACADFISRASRYNLDFTVVENYSNGLHLSAYAGAWQGLIEGMAGLRVEGEGLSFRPQLPLHWNGYRFAIHFRGRRLLVTVPGNGMIRIEHEGMSVPVEHLPDGRTYCRGALA